MKSSKLKYLQTKERILQKIRDERYEPGHRLPTESELVGELTVSRNTLRLAVDSLVEAGIVRREQGRGTFYVGRNHLAQRVVGFVNFNYLYYIYPDIVHGIEDELYGHGYSLILSNCNHDRTREIEHIRRLVAQGIQGLIVEPSSSQQIHGNAAIFKELEQAGIPIVTTNCRIPFLGAASVALDDDSVGNMLTSYLLDRGHRRIAFLYMSDVWAGEHRYQGYLQALASRGVKPDPALIVPFDSKTISETTHPAEPITAELLSLKSPPTAIVYFNDESCAYGYRTIQNLGIRVPEDLSIVSVDDAEAGIGKVPGLTTIRHPKRELGRWAARLLIDLVDGKIEPVHVSIFPHLVERTSVRKIGLDRRDRGSAGP